MVSIFNEKLDVLTLIIELLIVGINIYLCPSNVFIVNLFSITSVFASLKYVEKNYYPKKYLVKFDALKKHTYIFILNCACIIDFILWGHLRFMYIICYVVVCPSVMNIVIKTNIFSKVYDHVYTNYQQLKIVILSKAMAKTINFISKVTLECDPKIGHKEISPFIEKIQNNKKYEHTFGSFLSSFVAASLLHYIDLIGYTYYAVIIKKYLMYGKKRSSRKNKEYIIEILRNRDWDKLLDIYSLTVFLRVYNNTKTEERNVIKKHINCVIKKISNTFQQIMVNWTLGALTKCYMVTSLLSTIYLNESFMYNFIIMCPIYFMMLSSKSYFLLATVTEVSILILNSTLFSYICDEMKKFIEKKLNKLTYKPIEASVIITSLLFALIKINILYATSCLIILHEHISKYQKLRIYLVICITSLFGHLSSHNIIHCMVMPIIFNLLICMVLPITRTEYSHKNLIKFTIENYRDNCESKHICTQCMQESELQNS